MTTHEVLNLFNQLVHAGKNETYSCVSLKKTALNPI